MGVSWTETAFTITAAPASACVNKEEAWLEVVLSAAHLSKLQVLTNITTDWNVPLFWFNSH